MLFFCSCPHQKSRSTRKIRQFRTISRHADFGYYNRMQRKAASLSVKELAQRVQGTVLGDSALTISGVCSLDAATAGHLSFIRSKSSEHLMRELLPLPAIALLVSREIAPESMPKTAATIIVVPDAYLAFVDLLPLFVEEDVRAPGIHPTAVVASDARIGKDASIGAYCVIGTGASIGDAAVLHPHVRVYDGAQIGSHAQLFSGVVVREECIIGDRVTIHDNSVIGADGFGYIPDPTAKVRKVPQIGNVVIGDDVEIGASTCIDRGAIGSTRIGRGTKIDNLVQIGHNTVIGAFCFVCGGTGIAGSCTVGDGVVIGGACGIADHCEIVSGVRLGGWTGVVTSLTEPGDYAGFPAMKAGDWRRQQVRLLRLTREKSVGRA